jgi:hypothetical protein
MNAGRRPPIVTLPTRNGFAFLLIIYLARHPKVAAATEEPRSRAEYYANQPA